MTASLHTDHTGEPDGTRHHAPGVEGPEPDGQSPRTTSHPRGGGPGARPAGSGASVAWDVVRWGFVGVLLGLAGIFVLRYYLAQPRHPFDIPPDAQAAAMGVEPLPAGHVTLAFAGEVMPGRNVARSVAERGHDFAFLFAETAPHLRTADLAFCNLSCPVTDLGAPIDKQYPFRAPPEAVEGLVHAGFDVVSVANKHILDYGAEAAADTLARLRDAGMQPVGLAHDDGPQDPVIASAGGLRVGFLAYCDPGSPYACQASFEQFAQRPPRATREALARDIRALRERADLVVVSMHWGPPYIPEPEQRQRDLARFIIAQGADIVAGHGAHVLQEPEWYGRGLILYSLGNFVFDQYTRPATRESRLYRVVAGPAGVAGAAYLPLTIARDIWQPRPTQDDFVPVPRAAAVPTPPRVETPGEPVVDAVRDRAVVFLNRLARERPPFHYILPVVAMVLVGLYAGLGRMAFVRGLIAAFLLAAALTAVWNYTQEHWRQGRYFNAYEFYHYYLGSKYAEEVGYTNLYNAVFVADSQTGYRVASRTVRDLDTHEFVPGDRVLEHADEYEALFSEARWEEFKADVVFFRGKVSGNLWRRMLNDKGYNATPIWTMVAGFFSNRVPTSNERGMALLPLLDLAFIGLGLACVAWAFGHRALLLAVLFIGTHYLTSHFTLKAAFMRMDWVMCLVMAVCLVRRGWFKTAGAVTAYAVAARVFPVIFVFGLGARFLFDFVRRQRFDPRYFGYFATLALTGAALAGASVLVYGIAPWREFLEKIAVHQSDISPWRVGFKYVFLMSYDGGAFWGANLQEFFEQHQTAWWSIQAAVLIVSLVLVQRLDDWEALAYGYVPAFFLVAPTYYYHVMLVVPLLFFAGRMERPSRAAGLVYLFATGIAGHWLYGLWDRTFPLFFTMSCLLLALVLYMMALSLAELFRKHPAPGPEAPPEGEVSTHEG